MNSKLKSLLEGAIDSRCVVSLLPQPRPSFGAGWAPEKLNPKPKSLAEGAITSEALAGATAAVFGCPTQPFTLQEVAALHAFVEQVSLHYHKIASCCI